MAPILQSPRDIMRLWASLRLVVLALALGVLGWLLYSRGNPTTLGGRPARIEAAYRTEEAWIVTEILAAMTELTGPGPSAVPFEAPSTTAADHVYVVAPTRDVRVDLTTAVWSPEAFAPAAEAALSGHAAASTAASLDVHRDLLAPGPRPIVEAAMSAGTRLGVSPRDAAAHEAAAMTLAAFAFREAAGAYYTDLRPALNRLTAHLALAAAARGGAPPSTDGRLARVLLDALAEHGGKVTAALDAHPESTPEARAWATTARLRISDDWRLLPEPARATRPEQIEFYRARRATLPGLSAAGELQRLGLQGATDVEWHRIARSFSSSVGDAGDAAVDAVDEELGEARAVHDAMRLQGASAATDTVLLLRDGAVDDRTSPAARVLPWRLWSGQVQRHLAHGVAEIDRYLRHRLGNEADADRQGTRLDARLSGMPLLPLGALGRTTGTSGGLGDFADLRDGIALVTRSPEAMPYLLWTYLELASRYEPLATRMPVWSEWFTPPSPRYPYQQGHRAAGQHLADLASLEALAGASPDDGALPGAFLRARYGTAPPPAEVERLLGARLHYDARALTYAAGTTRGEARFRYQERACALVARECVTLGRLYVDAGREADAERSYVRAFDDPDYDAVSLANMMPWLVEQYAATGRAAAAVALAERGAASGAYMGHLVASRLYDQLGDLEKAEAHARGAAAYDSPGDLFGFYYRAVHHHKRPLYIGRLDLLRHDLFPDGLRPAPTSLSGPPARGVLVYKDSEFSRAHGVQAGDIIVGVEGWEVADQRQYRAASGTASTNVLKLTLWRGKVLQVEMRAAARLMGVEFRNHPKAGWTD